MNKNPAVVDSLRQSCIPARSGPRPSTTKSNPHHQTDQYPAEKIYSRLHALVLGWPDVVKAPSRRASFGSVGLYLPDSEARGPSEAFLLSTEFAHLHANPDGGLHIALPPGVLDTALAQGWGERHPLAGHPTISTQTTLIFAPRDAAEVLVVKLFIEISEVYARGLFGQD